MILFMVNTPVKQKNRKDVVDDRKKLNMIKDFYRDELICEEELYEIIRSDFKTLFIFTEFTQWRKTQIATKTNNSK